VPQDRKTRIVLNNLELVRADIERTVEESDDKERWRERVRGVLMYHLTAIYEEGAGYTKDLETSIAILRNQVEYLKKQIVLKDTKND
jgi:hypothetical protein